MTLIRNALSHYKTTMFGFLAAVFTYLAAGKSWESAVAAAFVALLGSQAKDGDK